MRSMAGRAIGGRLRTGAEEPPAGDLVLRGEGEPGREVLFGAPSPASGKSAVRCRSRGLSSGPDRARAADVGDLALLNSR